ncbi:Protein-tyrosine sulfotransferase [Nymphaea thermarum]|nr:Protein-tyrosine sulfotransferase [Nymphaea thermarum]
MGHFKADSVVLDSFKHNYATTLMASASPPMDDGFESCENTVQSWAYSSYDFDDEIEAKQLRSLQEMLFFLHVPRTRGLNGLVEYLFQIGHIDVHVQCAFASCTGNIKAIPMLYVDLVSDIAESRSAECIIYIMVTKVYSLVSKLPKKRTSVVTMVRHPLDRVISIYELSTVRAARYLLYPNMTSATEAAKRQCSERPHALCHVDMWPFKHLMPRLAVELFARREIC